MELSVVRCLLSDWGTTYGPAGEGPFPSVMLLHGSEGGMSGWTHRTAAILAANGFLCYPHNYSKGGNAWNAGHIEDVEISRTAEALAALRSFATGNGKVAVYGVSRGAEHALLLSSLMAQHDQYPGPRFLSVGLEDRTWAPDMTRRLEERRRKAHLPSEIHFYESEGHVPGSEGENRHHELLIQFLQRTLST